MRIALLADLFEPVGPDCISPQGVVAFEIADALREVVINVGDIAVDLVARRGSWRGLPLLSIDPDDLPSSDDSPLDRWARQEALYCQLIIAGMLRQYDVIHCAAPLVTPLQLLRTMNIPIVRTIVTGREHPSVGLAPALIPPQSLVSVAPARAMADGGMMIELSVDVERFRPDPGNRGTFLVWSGGPGDRDHAEALASLLHLTPRSVSERGEDPVAILRDAAVLAWFDGADGGIPYWPLRALASGIPVAGWSGPDLEDMAGVPGNAALAPFGDVRALAAAIGALPHDPVAISRRRELALARKLRRAMASRYCDLYKSLREETAAA